MSGQGKLGRKGRLGQYAGLQGMQLGRVDQVGYIDWVRMAGSLVKQGIQSWYMLGMQCRIGRQGGMR